MRPGAPPKSCGYVFHGSRLGVFVGHRPPRDPGDPPLYEKKSIAEVLHLHRCYTHTHSLYCHTQLCHAPTLSHTQSCLTQATYACMQHVHTHLPSHCILYRFIFHRIHLSCPSLSSPLIFVHWWGKKCKRSCHRWQGCGHLGLQCKPFYHLRLCVPSGPNLRFGWDSCPTSQIRSQRSLQCWRAMDQCAGGAQPSIRKRILVLATCSYAHATVRRIFHSKRLCRAGCSLVLLRYC